MKTLRLALALATLTASIAAQPLYVCGGCPRPTCLPDDNACICRTFGFCAVTPIAPDASVNLMLPASR